MAMLKKAATLAILAGVGVMGTAGVAAADEGGYPAAPQAGDDQSHQEGLIPVDLLNNVDVSPNLGCALDRTAPNLTAQSLVGLVPIGASLNHLLEHANLNVLANGNTTTDVYDNSCTSNQGSSQAGDNSHGSTGAGSSYSHHSTGDGAGSHNSQNGEGAGGLLGGTGVLGTGGPVTTGTTTAPPTTGTIAPPATLGTMPTQAGPAAAADKPQLAALTGSLAHTGADVGGPLIGAGAALLTGFALRSAARKLQGAK